MKKQIINFITLIIILLLFEWASLTLPKAWVYWFGVFSGITLTGGYSLLRKEYLDYLD